MMFYRSRAGESGGLYLVFVGCASSCVEQRRFLTI